ncbi:MAG: tRNA uridine-5-carboxymethylaminomethyl(34) synthesis GTPase MnmE [Gammaproteobacteria bacterium]
MTGDTIAAVATAAGRAGIGVVRVSGPAAGNVARDLCGSLPEPRRAAYRSFRDAAGDVIDEGLLLHFPGPASFTGEDVVEFQGHGGPVVLDLLMEAVLMAGARAARPGEFSERAFLNGRMDLAQAEAVADLIDAGSRAAAKAAVRSLDGQFSELVHALERSLVELRVYVEAAIDFPDEEVDFLSDGVISKQLADISRRITDVQATATQGRVLRDGLSVVILGQPNAGKSSLLNALSGRETAIVTEIPGTTRDVLREFVHLGPIPLHVVDTAGLRESDDPVEREGIRRAWSEVEQADHVFVVIDDREGLTAEDRSILGRLPARTPVTLLFNKVDLSGRPVGPVTDQAFPTFALCARSGAGLTDLTGHVEKLAGLDDHGEGLFLARRRHLNAIGRAEAHVRDAREQLDTYAAGELVAEELRRAHDALGEITGQMSSDDLLGEIFGSFCIGK